jgi:outer membrane immunogenic protein
MKESKMKLLFSSILAVSALFAGAAVAADLPSRKAPPVIVTLAPEFVGPYFGVEAGYAWTLNPNVNLTSYSTGWQQRPGVQIGEFALDPVFSQFAVGSGATAHLNTNGFIGGGVLGWNFRPWNSALVVGVEANFDMLPNSRRTATFATAGIGTVPTVAQLGSSWNWAALVGPRIGYAMFPTTMVYVRGGLALAQTSQSITSLASVTTDFSKGQRAKIIPGWFIGGGLEWAFAPKWSAKFEYRHADFGRRSAAFTGLLYGAVPPLTAATATQFIGTKHIPEEAVLIGLNRRLDFFGH